MPTIMLIMRLLEQNAISKRIDHRFLIQGIDKSLSILGVATSQM